MALPNSLNKVNRKIFTFFHETENNRSQIEVQKNEQQLFETEIKRADPTQMSLNKINDLSFDWMNFEPIEYNEDTETGIITTKRVYQYWEIVIQGLHYEQLSALKHNYVFRFGTGQPLIDFDIGENRTLWHAKHIQSNSLENLTTNEYTFYYGINIRAGFGESLQEIDENGMQVKLELTLFNPNYYV